jgi:hypothetical protein
LAQPTIDSNDSAAIPTLACARCDSLEGKRIPHIQHDEVACASSALARRSLLRMVL